MTSLPVREGRAASTLTISKDSPELLTASLEQIIWNRPNGEGRLEGDVSFSKSSLKFEKISDLRQNPQGLLTVRIWGKEVPVGRDEATGAFTLPGDRMWVESYYEPVSVAAAAAGAVIAPRASESVYTIENLACLLREDRVDGVRTEIFEELASNGWTWNEIKKVCLANFSTPELQLQAQNVLKELIFKRDLYDAHLFKTTVKNLFPEELFRVEIAADGILRKDTSGFLVKFYQMKVFNASDARMVECDIDTTPYICIAIKAPGGRDLTSDIDTTVSVEFRNEALARINLQQIKWPRSLFRQAAIRIEEYDPGLLIQSAIIVEFNRLNEESLYMTSGESRDSNVYSDGFLNESAYPKFERWDFSFDTGAGGFAQGLNEASDLEKERFWKIFWENFYAPYKKSRQEQELAAGLSFIYQYFEGSKEPDKKLNSFAAKLNVEWGKRFPEGNVERLFQNSLRSILELTSRLGVERKKAIEQSKEQLKTDYGRRSRLVAEHLNQDLTVHCMNLLYPEYLANVAHKKREMQAIKAQVNSDIEKLKAIILKIDGQEVVAAEAKNSLDRHPGNPRLKDNYQLEKNKSAEFKDNAALIRKDIKETIKRYGHLINEHQLALIRANLMASEAYVNYSAPYHVVQWKQMGEEACIASRQIVMGSVLQQIGFRLLHAQKLMKEKVSSGEILYRTCKYGERVADMLLGEKELSYPGTLMSDEEIRANLRTGEKTILSRLKAGYRFPEIEKQHYQILMRDIVVLGIKKHEGVDYVEKPGQCERWLRRTIYLKKNPGEQTRFDSYTDEEQLKLLHTIPQEALYVELQSDEEWWLSLAMKFIILSYESRLIDERKQRLWGGQDALSPASLNCIAERRLSLIRRGRDTDIMTPII